MIEGKAVARFGTGDILITPMVKTDFSGGFIVLQNKGTHTVGEQTQSFEPGDDDTVLSFDTVESLEVLIERLQKLKDMMSGDARDCLMGGNTTISSSRRRKFRSQRKTDLLSCAVYLMISWSLREQSGMMAAVLKGVRFSSTKQALFSRKVMNSRIIAVRSPLYGVRRRMKTGLRRRGRIRPTSRMRLSKSGKMESCTASALCF